MRRWTLVVGVLLLFAGCNSDLNIPSDLKESGSPVTVLKVDRSGGYPAAPIVTAGAWTFGEQPVQLLTWDGGVGTAAKVVSEGKITSDGQLQIHLPELTVNIFDPVMYAGELSTCSVQVRYSNPSAKLMGGFLCVSPGNMGLAQGDWQANTDPLVTTRLRSLIYATQGTTMQGESTCDPTSDDTTLFKNVFHLRLKPGWNALNIASTGNYTFTITNATAPFAWYVVPYP